MSLILVLVSLWLLIYVNENSQCSFILCGVFPIMEDPIYSALENYVLNGELVHFRLQCKMWTTV